MSRPQYAGSVSRVRARFPSRVLDQRHGLLGREARAVRPVALDQDEPCRSASAVGPSATARRPGRASPTGRDGRAPRRTTPRRAAGRTRLPRRTGPRQRRRPSARPAPPCVARSPGRRPRSPASASRTDRVPVPQPRSAIRAGGWRQLAQEQLAPGLSHGRVAEAVVGRLVEGLGLGVPDGDVVGGGHCSTVRRCVRPSPMGFDTLASLAAQPTGRRLRRATKCTRARPGREGGRALIVHTLRTALGLTGRSEGGSKTTDPLLQRPRYGRVTWIPERNTGSTGRSSPERDSGVDCYPIQGRNVVLGRPVG